MLFAARFGYGTIKPTVLRTTSGFTSLAGPDAVTLRSSIEMRPSDRGVVSYFTVKKGNRVELQFSWHPSHKSAPPMLDVRRELDKTNRLWLDWASRCTYDGRYREAVMRSLITLKALTYAPTGAIVAAPTTSLPEEIGGVRNWDYRFCWLRDASLTLSALILCGYVDEAVGFRDWLLRATAGDPEDVRIMYDLGGGRRLTEFELDELRDMKVRHPSGSATLPRTSSNSLARSSTRSDSAHRMGDTFSAGALQTRTLSIKIPRWIQTSLDGASPRT
jgi:GH15 family glucan-1,4-alpha-glucosidase